MTYRIDFSDPTISTKTPFSIPEYRTEGPAHPLNAALNGGGSGSVTASTSLLLVGKGFSNYGEVVQKNLVFMLENFASNAIPPAYPTIGQLWYDNSTATLNVYTGVSNAWVGLMKDSGGTMSGPLDMGGNRIIEVATPVNPNDAATKSYCDEKISRSGDEMEGPFQVLEPVDDADATTKRYVDDLVSQGVGGSISSHEIDPLLRHINPSQEAFLGGLSPALTADEVNSLIGINLNHRKFTIVSVADDLGSSSSSAWGELWNDWDAQSMLGDETTPTKIVGIVGDHRDVFTPGYVFTVETPGGVAIGSVTVVEVVLVGGLTAVEITPAITVSVGDIASTDKLTSVQLQLDSKLSLTGGVMSGTLYLPFDPMFPGSNTEAASKQYVDDTVALVSTVADNALPVAGNATMTGYFNLFADPLFAMHPVTKQYVDTTFVPLIGTTMAGFLSLYADPIDPEHAVTKQYVDDAITAISLTGGGGGLLTSGVLNTTTGDLTVTQNYEGSMVPLVISNIAAFDHQHTSNTILFTPTAASGTPLSSAAVLEVSTALNTLDTFCSAPTFVNPVVISTGNTLTLGQNPVNPLEASTKQYVDTSNEVHRSLITSTGQTVFTTPTYTPGSNKLWVFVNGIKAYEGTAESYEETTSTSITFNYTVPTGAKVEILVFGA